ncbi:D-arabitol-phosphate dehydrogenase [Eumeta japonica]|uniref:D-arabitol-phosphate dehydrogenase n=1 Tax=Eumeta variegata TaxID=151549 RepID=A0A4C1WYJ3_EUMVA|nr:D-arabitol-phosphate dehydrogenase [Eumeta japonica]
MEAVVFDGAQMKVSYQTDFPMPRIVNDDDVMVKVAYSGVCGTDLHIIQGEFPALKTRPLPLGHEFSGVVAEVGEKSIFKKGQKVVVDPNRACNLCDFCRNGNYHYCLYAAVNTTVGLFCDGGWAQYCVVPQDQVYLLPDEVTLEQAGLCEPYSCVAHGFDRASPLKVGQKILVVGAGIIDESSESRWSPPPMDTRNFRGAIRVSSASREEIGYLIEGRGRVDHRNSHPLHEKQQYKLLLHARFLIRHDLRNKKLKELVHIELRVPSENASSSMRDTKHPYVVAYGSSSSNNIEDDGS